MSTEPRKEAKTMSTEPEELLPTDLLLEIVARTDATTVVRCTGTGRNLRRAILDQAFRRRIAAEDGLDRALLFGVSFREHNKDDNVKTHTHRVIQTLAGPAKPRARLDDCGLRDSFKPVASRDSLLILRRGRAGSVPELRACDTLTGGITSVPPTSLPNAHLHVVLSVGGGGGNAGRPHDYELLVADRNAQFYQTFSSEDGRWSAVRQASAAPHRNKGGDSYFSAVIGRTVFLPRSVVSIDHWDHILALDLDAGEATLMDLPPGCLCRMRSIKKDEHLRLAAVRGRLCLLVSESQGIAMWTLTSPVSAPAATWRWSRRVVISSMEIARQMGLPAYPITLLPFCLEGVGERSGALILSRAGSRLWIQANTREFLRLDLGTEEEEEAPTVTTLVTHGDGVRRVTRFFLHEIGLASLLQAMKPF